MFKKKLHWLLLGKWKSSTTWAKHLLLLMAGFQFILLISSAFTPLHSLQHVWLHQIICFCSKMVFTYEPLSFCPYWCPRFQLIPCYLPFWMFSLLVFSPTHQLNWNHLLFIYTWNFFVLMFTTIYNTFLSPSLYCKFLESANQLLF